MSICRQISVVSAVLLLAGCAHVGGQKHASQSTHVYKAPESEGSLVLVVESVMGPIGKFVELATSITSPIANGVGSALNALGTGIGSALTIGPQGDHALTRVRVTGFDHAQIGSSAAKIDEMGSVAGRIEGATDD